MTDAFHEVDAQMRADKARAALVAALPWAVSVAVAALLATCIYWGWSAYQAKASGKASEAYANGVKAWNSGDDEAAKKDFALAASSGSRTYRALALIQQGQVAANTGRPAREAADFFDKAAKSASSPLIKDLAVLDASYVLLDSSPYKEIETRLTPLTDEKRPYHLEAREALAFAKILNGDLAGARTTLNALILNPDSTDGIKQRAQGAILIIDSGAAKSVPAMVKAELAMPAQPRMPADLMQQLQQQMQGGGGGDGDEPPAPQ
ncbi:MAG: hypothetical protein JWM33_635 [Caulobacteraceae bacterium]|nr:hypothetical protein [Caulobacteraceae bacterium]